MNHKPSININALLRHTSKANDFVRWLSEDGDALVTAADLLGGKTWAAKAKEVVISARTGGNVVARRNTLMALRRLLCGEYARFLDRPEAWRFASLHPDDPSATSAMLCAEALDHGLRALEALRLVGITKITEVM